MARNVVAAFILHSPYFIVFVDAPHPFGFIVTFFIGYFMVPGGKISHLVSQIMTLLSILVCGRPTSTATILVSFPLGTFILQLFLMEIRAFSVFLVHIHFSPSGCFCP